jgi:hypothetical protein
MSARCLAPCKDSEMLEKSFGGLMRKNSVVAVVTSIFAAIIFVLTPAPAFAAFGDLSTINPTGGLSTDDGLKIEIAQTEIQVTRDGNTQFYGYAPAPVAGTPGYMLNYFEVTFNDGEGDVEIGQYNSSPAWDSGTSEATLSADGKSGTVVNTLSYSLNGQPITLKVTFSYTYPNQYLNVATLLTLPSGWTYPTRVHWNADATLGGNDDGDQFEGTLASGQQVRGVISADQTTIEAFRQVQGQNVNSWAGYLDCPWGSYACTLGANSWIVTDGDAPNEISTATNIDNGFGISVPAASTPGEHAASFDILFVGCDSGADPIECINANIPPDPEPTPEPVLPNTGRGSIDVFAVSLASLSLAVGALGLVAIHRRAAQQ